MRRRLASLVAATVFVPLGFLAACGDDQPGEEPSPEETPTETDGGGGIY